MTAKQRARIYLEAAQDVELLSKDGMCSAIIHITGNTDVFLNHEFNPAPFPELLLFDPIEDREFAGFWFISHDQDALACRQLILLFCHAMALNP